MKNKTRYKIITILIPVLILTLFLIRNFLIYTAVHLPPCFFYSVYHKYCPACGNTRSVTALLHGDLLTSFRFNIVPFIFLILFILGYIELAAYSFGKRVHIFPRKLSFYVTLIVVLCLYWIIRNFIPYLTP